MHVVRLTSTGVLATVLSEDPAWIARMIGHTTIKMLDERYAAFIQYRTRQHGVQVS